MEKLLIPENDLQELWELNGRVKAVLAWTESDPYITKNVLTAMLGDPVQTDGVEQPQTEEPETSDSGAGLSVRKGEADDEQD